MKTPQSSTLKSVTSSIIHEEERSELRDSCYYPGCRKDANCKCEMCLDSINAVRDLRQNTIQKSSVTTKVSTSKPMQRTPISYNPSILSTPISRNAGRVCESPALKSTARLRKNDNFENTKEKEKVFGFGVSVVSLILCLGLIFVVEFGGPWVISRVLKTDLSADLLRNLGEKSWKVKDLNGKLEFVQRELKSFIVDGEISNCSSANSIWKINRDGLVLHSRCTLYRSATEEVTIWGWPLQTAGLLATGHSSRSFTILAGRVTEWSDGKLGYSIRNAPSSWKSDKWRADAVQLDKNTWILEYSKCFILENPRLISATMELLKLRMTRATRWMKLRFWTDFKNWWSYSYGEDRSNYPT